MSNKLRVFYNKNQTVDGNASFSPSAGKPAKVLAQYQAKALPILVQDFAPLTVEDFYRAHDKQFVDDVLACRRTNGFGNTSKEVAESLAYTTGSLYAAAHHAMLTGDVTCSPTSGFHHSGYSHSGGFCTFNGLMIAAQKLIVDGAKKIAILDIDNHFGDGTENIINALDLKMQINHWTFGGENINPKNADAWLEQLPSLVKELVAQCDVLIYQAGADPWIGDPLGGNLTKEQLLKRDMIVFDECRKAKIGVVYNLAGGYAPDFSNVLDIHTNTALAAIKAFNKASTDVEPVIETVGQLADICLPMARKMVRI